MSRLGKRFLKFLYSFLSLAPLFIWIGQIALDNYALTLAALGGLLPLAYALTLIPGRLGGALRDAPVVIRSSGGGDPDPDRNLRSDSHEGFRCRRSFPLRVMACIVLTLAAFAAVFFLPVEPMRSAELIPKLAVAATVALTLPIALAAMGGEEAVHANGIAVGLVSYAVSGLALYYIDQPQLNAVVLALGAVFLLITGLFLNDRSLDTGSASRSSGPPASIRGRNRRILFVLALLVGVVALFDNIRMWARVAIGMVMRAIGAVLGWFADLFGAGLLETTVGPSAGGGPDPLEGLPPPGDPALFWVIMEKIAYVVATILAIGLLILAVRKFYGKIRELIRRIVAFFRRFSRFIEADYLDERESLLDWSEAQRALNNSLRKRWARLTHREKRWEQMDVRERVRYLVRALYRKNPAAAVPSRTVHEAIRHVGLGAESAARLGAMYDVARYSEHFPDSDEVSAMKREVRL